MGKGFSMGVIDLRGEEEIISIVGGLACQTEGSGLTWSEQEILSMTYGRATQYLNYLRDRWDTEKRARDAASKRR